MTSKLPVLNIHTPTSSFAIAHDVNSENITALFDKLSRKSNTEFYGKRVGPSWLKYEFNSAFWNLDDDADYTIFIWRISSPEYKAQNPDESVTLHLHDPTQPLPSPSSYRNPSFYLFRPERIAVSRVSSPSLRSKRTKKSEAPPGDGIPQFKKEFEKFHLENGVRTVVGSIGPVENVRMLLKTGYRYVYISRKFAMRHGFIPADAAPGYYGYGGLVNIGKWPITVGRTKTIHSVYLSEESHFDVVLGRSFMEKRQIKTNPIDPTDLVSLDTGEKLDCELVILKDGKGEIVTVT
ncbi:hypothetical protein EWM64_g5431 [Hericium alpestre]|uniref:Uncharacterized protein n=1 Tax=Hericium alpestre TaxID=135208 RepID=A0A4Y9ZUV8_9AGAM|nr:hypothetical protein EWM64_g5431 [Hericium alpestre]